MSHARAWRAPDEAAPELRVVARGRGVRRGVPSAWVQLAMILAALAVLPFVTRVDNDFWWHLRTGDVIVHGGIPRHDPFSWTAAGKRWVTHEWLSEALIYAVESALGYAGNALLFDAVAIASVLIMYRCARAMGAGTRPLVVVLLVAALVLRMFITVRPQLFTWLFLAVFISLLVREDGATTSRRAWLLPPLMALWANLHLGFVYGEAVVGCWLLSRVIARLGDPSVRLGEPALVTLGCVAAAMLTPAGPPLLLYPLRYLTDGHETQAHVAEWQRPNPLNVFRLPIFIVAAALALALISRHRPRPFLVLVSALFIALSMQAVRNAPFAALVALPVVGVAASRRWPRFGRDTGVRIPIALALLFPAISGGLVVAGSLGPGSGTASLLRPSERQYPGAAIAYADAHLRGERVLNYYDWGGYQTWKAPALPVAIDGRTDFYGDALMKDYFTMIWTGNGWEALLDAYGVDAVLLPAQNQLVEQLRDDPSWAVTFEGAQAVVIERR